MATVGLRLLGGFGAVLCPDIAGLGASRGLSIVIW